MAMQPTAPTPARRKSTAALLLPWLLPPAAWGVGPLEPWGPGAALSLASTGQVLDTAAEYIFAPPGSGPYAGRFVNDALASLGRVGGGFALAVALGLPLGLLSGRLRFMRLFLDTFINGCGRCRASPGCPWPWCGSASASRPRCSWSPWPPFPIYLGAAAGAMQINPLLLRPEP